MIKETWSKHDAMGIRWHQHTISPTIITIIVIPHLRGEGGWNHIVFISIITMVIILLTGIQTFLTAGKIGRVSIAVTHFKHGRFGHIFICPSFENRKRMKLSHAMFQSWSCETDRETEEQKTQKDEMMDEREERRTGGWERGWEEGWEWGWDGGWDDVQLDGGRGRQRECMPWEESVWQGEYEGGNDEDYEWIRSVERWRIECIRAGLKSWMLWEELGHVMMWWCDDVVRVTYLQDTQTENTWYHPCWHKD